jgi:hypothetical protein
MMAKTLFTISPHLSHVLAKENRKNLFAADKKLCDATQGQIRPTKKRIA